MQEVSKNLKRHFTKKNPLKAIKNIVYPSLKEVKAHSLVQNHPWPGPSPYAPKELANSVIHVPKDEIDEFLEKVVSRYITTIKKYSLANFRGLFSEVSLKEVSDSEFSSIFEASVFSRFVNSKLDSKDFETFFDFIEENKTYYKLDFQSLETMDQIDKVYHCPSVTLFELNNNKLRPIAISLNNIIVTPQDKSWKLSKYFVLQGASIVLLSCEHPRCHFPMDAINGITKCLIPKNHLMRKLMEPHMYMQLPLNFAVLYISKSVAHNDQNEIYTPFTCSKNGFINSIRSGFAGIKGNSSYPAYRYNLGPQKVFGPYGVFLKKYWDTIYSFVAEVLSKVDRSDPLIKNWAKEISHQVPGFPDDLKILQSNNLELAVTSYIHNVSVAHATDHHNYASHDFTKMPIRLRVPPPHTKNDDPPIKLNKLISSTDLFRHNLASKMYFEISNIKTLLEVDYDFKEENLIMAQKKFHQSLILTEENMPVKRFIMLQDIACSMQY